MGIRLMKLLSLIKVRNADMSMANIGYSRIDYRTFSSELTPTMLMQYQVKRMLNVLFKSTPIWRPTSLSF